MVEVKYYCDRCKKEIRCIPPGPDSSVIRLEGEKYIQVIKGPYNMSLSKEITLFEDSLYPTEIVLCHNCSLLFKKYMDAFWEK